MEVDAGSLAVFDSNAVAIGSDMGALQVDQTLLERAQAATQALFDVVFALPVEATDANGVLAILPTPSTKLPRALPVPSEAKLTTRWEKFAKEKGIMKRKKGRRVFDEKSGELKVRYGYDEKREKDRVPDDWLIEVPNSNNVKRSAGFDQGTETDAYSQRAQDKAERVAKNKSQQRRNQLENAASGLTPKEARKMHLKAQLKDAKTSTASIGRFDETVKGEEKVKFKRAKRKFDDVTGDAKNERAKVSKVVEGVNKKVNPDGGIIATKAVSQIVQQQKRAPMQKKRGGKK
ncbi:Rhodanese- sulfurtransferase [Chytriomyces hyalinus]|nr:Rhodanese- sulfurtransferase [Chytriomyces hyalinus]KAJ3251889.1 Rhodanese- sulfurtransferase [Chytriomyces hyalinus]